MSETIKKVLGNIDKGFFHSAKAQDIPRSSFGYLTDMFLDAGIEPEQKDIDKAVQKLLAKAGFVGAALDALPVAALERFEQHAIDTWGLERALEASDIRIKGATSDRLEKFFTTSGSMVLFPIYLENMIIAGLLLNPILQNLVATETNINSHTYESLFMADTASDRQLVEIDQGVSLPVTTIKTADHAVKLKKFGRLLMATYESLRLQRLNVVGLFLQRMGRQLAIDETDWALETLISGDGNNNAVAMTNSETSETLTYDDLVDLHMVFPDNYTFTTAVANVTTISKILKMSEFKDPMAGFQYSKTGILPGPLGANWFKWRSTGAPSFSGANARILAIDNVLALEQITEQGVMTESDRLIEKQFERTAITKWTGFAKLDPTATQCLDINHG